MHRALRIAAVALVVSALFGTGYVAGQNKFGQPKSIIHVVIVKWKDGVPDAEKQTAIEGVKEMAAKIPGIKNVWLQATRLQLRTYDAAFAIEFANREAADDYAEHPAHAAWAKQYLAIREASLSLQVTNPE